MRKPSAAGIVVLRDGVDDWEALVLWSDDDEPDLPKGKIDPGETYLETAIRETAEEAGITELDFQWGTQSTVVGKTTVMYIASTTQEPVIEPNVATGVLEHMDWEWIPLIELYGYLEGSYLQPVADWAFDAVD